MAQFKFISENLITSPQYKLNHPWGPKIVAIVDRWLFFRGGYSYVMKCLNGTS